MCMGAFPESCELAKTAKNTYYAREAKAVIQVEARGVSSRPTAEEVGESRVKPRNRSKSPLRTTAASAVAQEQSQRSSALLGLVSMTTISVLKSTYRSEPTWRLWSGPSSASYHFFFFFFFVGQGGGSAAKTMKSRRGEVVSRPLHTRQIYGVAPHHLAPPVL